MSRHRKHKGQELRAMKRERIEAKQETLFEKVTSFESLYHAHTLCRRGKRHKEKVATFDLRAGSYTYIVRKSLLDKTWHVGGYHKFVLSERGKMRKISAAPYQARVVQRSLHENVMLPIVHKSFCKENSDSQKGKGPDFARALLKTQMESHFHKYGVKGGILIGDIHNFFGSLNHDILEMMYEKLIDDKDVLWLIKKIHDSTGTMDSSGSKIGMALGNEVSQTDGVLVLSRFDHLVKERWHIPYYGRYMDDFYLIHPDIEYLRSLLDNRYGLTLNPTQTKVVTITQGIKYLGFRFKMSDTGAVIITVLEKNVKRNTEKSKRLAKKLDNEEIDFETIYISFLCWMNHISFGNTYGLRQSRQKRFCERFEKHIIEGIRKGYVSDPRKKKKETSPTIFPDDTEAFNRFKPYFDERSGIGAVVT